MGHDITGFNKKNERIAYMRFAMWNDTSYLFYELFDAMDFQAGDSGNGRAADYSMSEIKQAQDKFQLEKGTLSEAESKAIEKFIDSCLSAVKEGGAVTIAYA